MWEHIHHLYHLRRLLTWVLWHFNLIYKFIFLCVCTFGEYFQECTFLKSSTGRKYHLFSLSFFSDTLLLIFISSVIICRFILNLNIDIFLFKQWIKTIEWLAKEEI